VARLVFQCVLSLCLPHRELSDWLSGRRGALVLGKGWTTCAEDDVSHKGGGDGWVTREEGSSFRIWQRCVESSWPW